VGSEHRRYWNPSVRDWVTDATTFDVGVGGDSTVQLTGSFEVTLTEG
jgi:beta-glucosidase